MPEDKKLSNEFKEKMANECFNDFLSQFPKEQETIEVLEILFKELMKKGEKK